MSAEPHDSRNAHTLFPSKRHNKFKYFPLAKVFATDKNVHFILITFQINSFECS